MRMMLNVVLAFMPWGLKRVFMKKFLGYKLHKNSYIGFSVVNAKNLSMADNAKIGHLNIVRNMSILKMKYSSTIGNLNWISGEAFDQIEEKKDKKNSFLKIGSNSAITNRHYLDCSGGLSIGEFTIFAGVKSTLLTHSIDIEKSVQKLNSIKIGDYCFISSNCIFIGGSSLPSYSVVGAGSVIRNQFDKTYFLYSGNPAQPIKNISKNSNYFSREKGHVK